MRQGADADPLDAGLGKAADAAEVHAAGGLQFDRRIDGVAAGHGLAEFGRAHIVQQHQVRSGRHGRVELPERIHLDLDDHGRVGRVLLEEAAGPLDGLAGRNGGLARRRALRTAPGGCP